jgi:hypothetical protein
MPDPTDEVFGPKVHAPASEADPAVRRPKLTEQRPLSEIQAELREETTRRARGDHRKGRRV